MDMLWKIKQVLFEGYLTDIAAEKILNLPVSEERDCPICYKGGLVGELTNPEYRGCAKCNSTGKLLAKTLKQLIEEAQK